MLQLRLELSERRACRIAGQHRSTQRHVPQRGRGDDGLRSELRAFSRRHTRWGYRRAWATLRGEGWTVNRKKVQRLWREEGLRVPTKRRKRRRLGDSSLSAERLRAECPNHVWALDFEFDQTADGRRLKLLNVVDEYTREALATEAQRRITADATVETLEQIVLERGVAPARIRCDNGPELTANALRDWCRSSGTGTSYIEPGAPWENPFVESFNGRMRDELLAIEQFDTLLEAQVLIEDWRIEYNTRQAQVLIEDWRIEYNTRRPHSSLGWLAPATFAARWNAEQADGLS
jgi:transposase InsO family protein